VLTRDDVSRAKPDPELYSAALDCLGMDAELALAFEDSTHGVTAATEAGMRCVAVPSSLTAASDFSRAVRVLDSLAAIDPEQLWDEVDGL
jgi:beta-phosphoglucomutase-like phosphatase (HAD superfamily)